MILTVHSPENRTGSLRLAIFWLVGLIAVLVYLWSGIFLLLPARPVSMIGVPVVGCFLISIAMGLWTRKTSIIIRALAAISCVAIPAAVVVLANIGVDL